MTNELTQDTLLNTEQAAQWLKNNNYPITSEAYLKRLRFDRTGCAYIRFGKGVRYKFGDLQQWASSLGQRIDHSEV